MKNNIYLIGFMGAGKTTVGRALAKQLQMEALDLDAWIEEEEGMTAAQIFASKGEMYFREKESEILKRSAAFRGIITTGGGIISRAENRECLKKSGFTCFLDCDPDILIARVQDDPARPLAFNRAREEMIALYQERLPFYKACADIIIDTSDKTVEQVVQLIAGRIK
ncbi:shikimate kinase [Heyndrickxia acidiproducens]|uniref:shikimate kinase n=1 Tax=Heyndrickxia acidiproducens TaxID=1121084 RepID=UPI0003648D88|nr:shikimate kinase [Heyndrickxia acidiproducens]